MSGEKSFDLTKVHEVNLKLLKEIDRICRKYKIKYALDSGTLLGAVRHGGFIPWDDDVDVMFTRKNYEMFAKVVRRELPEDMSFVEPNEYHGGKAFYDFISRVTYNKSQKFEDSGKMEFYDDKISRLNVDLFIVDGDRLQRLQGRYEAFCGSSRDHRKADPIPGDLEAVECPLPYGQQERAPVIFLHGLRAELVLCGDEERVGR